jgi:hypothetical protein
MPFGLNYDGQCTRTRGGLSPPYRVVWGVGLGERTYSEQVKPTLYCITVSLSQRVYPTFSRNKSGIGDWMVNHGLALGGWDDRGPRRQGWRED